MTGEAKTIDPVVQAPEQPLDGILQLLSEPEAQTAPNNQAKGWRRDCEYVLGLLDEQTGTFMEALPSLRLFVANCPGCEGYGAVIHQDESEEPCKSCESVRIIIEMLTPKPFKPSPKQPPQDFDDGIPF